MINTSPDSFEKPVPLGGPGSDDTGYPIQRGSVMTERGLQGPEQLEIADMVRQITAVTDEVVAQRNRVADDLDEAA